MRRVVAAALAGIFALTSLSGCGSGADPDTVVVDRSWQVSGIYTSADSPSVIPNAITQPPSLTFGARGLVGTSGCAQFRATASYFRAGEKSNVEDADRLTLDSVSWKPMDGDCAGEQLWAHNQFTRLFAQGHGFGLSSPDKDQLILTLEDAGVEPPSLRLVSVNPS
ncbi:hypothetical protein CPHO_02240 [Corynebacterium phocae]|uniref:DUF306 domain-containing protein n=1 Tax=Corynebacterium phocae TaxID=161895 RepID=A0A1L7D1E9_9CORY|nr:hypothetical protein [Corynebacterium phocae]APT91924.1 hypothetical protein CPHO_02240 [Corynebacterium phocae]KAA8727380.1 hypothetical protein F4V58_01770 [Corynebacterium phocae]